MAIVGCDDDAIEDRAPEANLDSVDLMVLINSNRNVDSLRKGKFVK